MTDTDFWDDQLTYYKSEDAALKAAATWGKMLRNLNPLKRLIRKKKIVAMLEQGMEDGDIAKQNVVSEKTVYRIRVKWLKKKA